MTNVRIVPIGPHSDGNPTHRPKPDTYKLIDPPLNYLEKLAQIWLQARGERVVPGTIYRLDRLPHGYELYGRPRPSNSTTVDKHLFGSPRHRFFDSPNRFAPHFLHLMRTGGNIGCPCTVCGAVGKQPLPIRGPAGVNGGKQKSQERGVAVVISQPAAPSKPRVQTWTNDSRISSTLRSLLRRLERQGTLDEAYEEPKSMDWRAGRTDLRQIDVLTEKPSYVPRVGEVVLFVPSMENNIEICRDNSTQEYKLFDVEAKNFIGRPRWQAGIVAQVAHEAVTTTLEDVLESPPKTDSITYSGFKIEPLPQPGSDDKSLSKRYKYVSLNLTRPFVFWKEFTRGTSEGELHPTIANALRIVSSWSLVQKCHIKGTWPKASLLSKGVYLGSELLVTGDMIRFRSARAASGNPQDDTIDVLHVSHIKLELDNLDPAPTSSDRSSSAYNSSLGIYGKAYTLEASRADASLPEALSRQQSSLLSNGMKGYTWYHLHPPVKYTRIPFNLIVGRLFEAAPMLLWLSPFSGASMTEQPSLAYGYEGVLEAREYGKKHDKRIPTGKSFYWGESRGDCLDLHELNGVALSAHDPDRTQEQMEEWAYAADVLAKADAMRAKGKRKEKAVMPLKGSSLSTAVEVEDSETETENGERMQLDNNDNDITPKARKEKGKGPLGLDLSKFAYSEPAAAPSADEGEDEQMEASDGMRVRFGLGVAPQRKRSYSAAEKPDHVEGNDHEGEDEDESDELGGRRGTEMDLDDASADDVKGVSSPNATRLTKMRW